MHHRIFKIPASSLSARVRRLKLNSEVVLAVYFWRALEHAPIFCLSLTALWCVQSPHSSAGKSALLQPRHKQSALITHYTALHSTPFTCNIWGLRACAPVCLVLVKAAYDDFVCAQWTVSVLRWIAVLPRCFQPLTRRMSSMVRRRVDVTRAL